MGGKSGILIESQWNLKDDEGGGIGEQGTY